MSGPQSTTRVSESCPLRRVLDWAWAARSPPPEPYVRLPRPLNPGSQ